MKSNFAIVTSARKGLPARVFYDFVEAINMPAKDLASIINLSLRTISNYKDLHRKLEPVCGEHLLKLIALFEKGEQAFGSIDEFNYWLQKPFWNSAGKPMDWITTSVSIDFLNEELDKLTQAYPV